MIDPAVFHRSVAVELPEDPRMPRVQRYARGVKWVAERWRSERDRSNDPPLPKGHTLLRSKFDNAQTAIHTPQSRYKPLSPDAAIADMNGWWKMVDVERTPTVVWVHAKCTGPVCCEGRVPEMRKVSTEDWRRRLTSCQPCSNALAEARAQREQLREQQKEVIAVINESEKGVHYVRGGYNDNCARKWQVEKARRERLLAEGRCVMCRAWKSEADRSCKWCEECRQKDLARKQKLRMERKQLLLGLDEAARRRKVREDRLAALARRRDDRFASGLCFDCPAQRVAGSARYCQAHVDSHKASHDRWLEKQRSKSQPAAQELEKTG
jgi:hypothetical protein